MTKADRYFKADSYLKVLNPLPSITSYACIIEEQPKHLVVAVRISKAAVNANLSFFTALADATNRNTFVKFRKAR
jgi:hypothetical protein